MTDIAKIQSLIARMEAEGWQPRLSAVNVGTMQDWHIQWTRKPSPRVTLISADTGKDLTPKGA